MQFKAAGVTTVIVASDPYSAGLLTKAAAAQNYYPEWFIVGTGGTDLDGACRPTTTRPRSPGTSSA